MPGTFRFSFGSWNIHEGADPFGPMVRDSVGFHEKLAMYKDLGFDGVQFHDDDAVPDLEDLAPAQAVKRAQVMKKTLDEHGLVAEFVAPRLWEDPRGIDGAFTANDPACRRWALDRAKLSVELAKALGCDLVGFWLAREGTYIREAKDAVGATRRIVEACNSVLDADPGIRLFIEPKPNEPVDHAYIPTVGHALALAHLTNAPARVGGLIESAHAILAGLDPSDEMAYALAHKKLFSVHLNDQNGLKFDQDKSFGAVDLRRALNQVRVLDVNGYGNAGEWVGLDVKAMRTQKPEAATAHLANSRAVFLRLLEISRSLDDAAIGDMIERRDYEALEMYILQALTGGK